MRHRIYGKQLNRTSAHRTAMMRNLAAGLFEHGQIETTMPKAKLVRGYAEKLITSPRPVASHSTPAREEDQRPQHLRLDR